jgi:hypothetical protein
MAVSVGAECNSSIAMLLSPPPSPIMGRLVFTPYANLPMPPALGPATDSESDHCISIPNESTRSVSVSEKLTTRSPMRALSPTRAMSPIRNGIRRILSIGCSDNDTDK